MEWTSVEDSFPEEGEDVLVKEVYAGVSGKSYSDYTVAFYYEGGWRVTDDMITATHEHGYADIRLCGKVTHWTPIS